jgi:hypothetical protein
VRPFDSHMPCHASKATSQGYGTFVACWRLATPSSRKFIRSIPISDAVAGVKQSTLGEGQGSDRVAAGERNGMCESVFKTA